ncbi:hypothetical protein [Mycobacterium sp.]|uniref:hypothetical protein n=1 Tax=Mycobacterium sp. TaxID=1785 RepID=UPI003A8690A0
MKLTTNLMATIAAAATAATLVATAPVAGASPDQFCAELGGNWDGTSCTTVVVSHLKAERLISLDLPQPMLDNPTSGPVVGGFYHKLMDGWRNSGTQAPRDSSATATYELFTGPGAVQSLVVHEDFEPFGLQSNNAYRTFVFDMAQGHRLMLADLFKPGVDPIAAIAEAAGPFLPAALDAGAPPHAPNTNPYMIGQWTPGPDGPGFTGGYRAFALTQDDLIIHMPDVPSAQDSQAANYAWSMDGGAVTLQVPLAALAGPLRPEYGGV